MNRDSYLSFLRGRLSEKRLLHSISVAEHLLSFGRALGLEAEAMETAGLLHDCCRALDDEAMLETAVRYGIPISDICRERPILLHGPIGAEFIRHEFGIRDEALLEAVRWHTTGHPGIGLLARALFVADFSEPLRKYPEAGETREVLQGSGFDAALRYVAQTKLAFARKKERFHPETEAFCAWVEAGCPAIAVAP